MELENEIVLSLETTTRGGSISLLKGVSEIDSWIGSETISRDIGVLEETKKLLQKNDLKKKSIKKIIVCSGPGSLTGIRVGTAVGLGLKRSNGCELTSISSLYAMFLINQVERDSWGTSEVVTAIPAGRNQVYWEIFSAIPETGVNQQTVQISTIDDFFVFFKNDTNFSGKIFILHHLIYAQLSFVFTSNQITDRFIDAGENLAFINALAVQKRYFDGF